MKADRKNTVVFKLNQMSGVFLTPDILVQFHAI